MNGIQPFNNFGQTPLVFIYLHKYKRLVCVFYFSTGINRILEPITLGYHADAQPITTVCCNLKRDISLEQSLQNTQVASLIYLEESCEI